MTEEQQKFLADDAREAEIARQGFRISMTSAADWGMLPVVTHEGVFVCGN